MTDERYNEIHRMVASLADTLAAMRKEFATHVGEIRRENKEDHHRLVVEMQLMMTQLVEARTRLYVAEKDIAATQQTTAKIGELVGTHRITFEERMAKMEADYTERINAIRVDAAVRATQISLAGAFITWFLAMLPGWLKGH